MSNIFFVYPSFLWAIALIAIPIAIHLFSFRKYKTIYFTDVSLLEKINQSGKASKRLKHWLLLLLRCLTILFLVLAFSQPVQKDSVNTKQGRKLVCIYVDNSFSMGNVSKNGEHLQEAKLLADKIIKSYRNIDRFQILCNDFLPQDLYAQDQENAQNLVANIQLSYRSKSLSQVLKRQTNLIDKNQNYSPELYCLSDFQSLKEGAIFTKLKFPMSTICYQADQSNNISVDSIWFASPVRSLTGKDELMVRISNHHAEAVKNFALYHNINGKIQLASVDLPAESYLDYKFLYSVPKQRQIKGKVYVEEQGVKFDNEMFFTYQIPEKIKVLCISEQADFKKIMHKIFSSDSLLDLTYCSPLQVDFSSLDRYHFLILGQLDEITMDLSDAIYNYCLSKKGQVMVVPSSQINQNQYKFLGEKLNAFSYEQRDTTSKELMPANKSLSFFKGVFDDVSQEPYLKVKMPRIKKHYALKAKGSDFEVLMFKPNESPYLLYNNNAYIFASGLTKECSNFAQHALIVPVLYQMLYSSVLINETYYTLDRSKSIKVEDHWRKPVEIRLLDTIQFTGKLIGDNKNLRLLMDDNFNQSGYYFVSTKNQEEDVVAVNYSREESKQHKNAEQQLDKLMKQNSNVKKMSPNLDLMQKHIHRELNGVDFWQECLLLAIACLMAEMLLIRGFKP